MIICLYKFVKQKQNDIIKNKVRKTSQKVMQKPLLYKIIELFNPKFNNTADEKKIDIHNIYKIHICCIENMNKKYFWEYRRIYY